MLSVLNGLNAGLLGFLVALVPAIALHEMGHMFVAKWVGVWVREFGIGFPPRIAKLFHWQETEFTLNWVPLGGFARMEGEGIEENLSAPDAQEEPDTRTFEEIEEARKHSLHTQPPGKRTLIFLGGPLMNMLTGWVLAVVLFMTGVYTVDEMRVYITEIAPNSPAEAAGLQTEDVIVKVNEQSVTMLEQISEAVDQNLGTPITLTVSRGEEELGITLTPRVNPPEGEGAMGVGLMGEPTAYHTEPYPLFKAIGAGTEYYATAVASTLLVPVYIVQGVIPLEYARPSGVVGISRIAGQSIQQSVDTGTLIPILTIMILVNISLGIFNLLPIPVLDGGHILFTVIEKVRGKPLTPAIRQLTQQIAIVFFLLLFVVITIMDVVAPITLSP